MQRPAPAGKRRSQAGQPPARTRPTASLPPRRCPARQPPCWPCQPPLPWLASTPLAPLTSAVSRLVAFVRRSLAVWTGLVDCPGADGSHPSEAPATVAGDFSVTKTARWLPLLVRHTHMVTSPRTGLGPDWHANRGQQARSASEGSTTAADGAVAGWAKLALRYTPPGHEAPQGILAGKGSQGAALTLSDSLQVLLSLPVAACCAWPYPGPPRGESDRPGGSPKRERDNRPVPLP
jgi:hypothetical protein